MRVLVVEDEQELAAQLAEALDEAGYAVDLAHDGEEGHFLGDTEPYDAVVLDLGLPKLDGLTVLRRWRPGCEYRAAPSISSAPPWTQAPSSSRRRCR